MTKEQGGLGMRKLSLLNKVLLGKWIWRFASKMDRMWKRVICFKYGTKELGWKPKEAKGPYGAGLWKDITKEADWISKSWKFNIDDGSRVRFSKDQWCGSTTLSISFPSLFGIAANKNEIVAEVWDQSGGSGHWNLNLVRSVNDWEVNSVVRLLGTLLSERVLIGWDTVSWKGAGNSIYSIKEAYRVLYPGPIAHFLVKGIWVPNAPSKSAFYVWEAAWGKVLILDKLQKRGWQLPNRCYLCGQADETVNHLLLHCSVISSLWEIIFSLMGASLVFPKIVKEAIYSWKGSFVGKKRKKLWNSINLCSFWTVWKERNRIAFKMG